MLEIDSVTRAFDIYNTDQADDLSRRYLRVLDLATAPILTDREFNRLRHDTSRLREHSSYIAGVLFREPPVIRAYESAMEQVNRIIFERIRSGTE